MKTPYGRVDKSDVIHYMTKVIGRLYKIIPMNEEKSDTLLLYIDSLIREMIGNSKFIQLAECELLTIVGTLKGLNCKDHNSLRSDIFKAISIVNKIKKKVN